MKIAKPAKRRDSAETRSAILKAAEQHYAEYGLAGARTDAIAILFDHRAMGLEDRAGVRDAAGRGAHSKRS